MRRGGWEGPERRGGPVRYREKALPVMPTFRAGCSETTDDFGDNGKVRVLG